MSQHPYFSSITLQASDYALYSYVHGGNAEVCLSRGRVVLVDGRSKGCWVLGWFLSVDPLTRSYPMLTPYQFASLRPIMAVDLDGLEADDVTDYDGNVSKSFIQLIRAGEYRKAGNLVINAVILPESDENHYDALEIVDNLQNRAVDMEQEKMKKLQTFEDDLDLTKEVLDNTAMGSVVLTAGSGGGTSPVTVPVAAAATTGSIGVGVLKVGVDLLQGESATESMYNVGLSLLLRGAGKYLKGKAPGELFSTPAGKEVMDATIDMNIKTVPIFINSFEQENGDGDGGS